MAMAARNKDSSRDNVRRIILIGKTGNGKSSTGNSILGYPELKYGKSPSAVTQNCEKRTSITRKDWPLYEVCDTPGLLDTDVSLVDRVLEIQRSVKVCPVPHAFLLLFSSASRMTEDERFTIDILRITFGENVFKHCIVVFTRGGEFKQEGDFDSFLKDSPMLVELLRKCGNRVVRIENKNDIVKTGGMEDDIRHLLALIEQVSSDGQRFFQYLRLGAHTDALKNHRQYYKGKSDIGSVLTDISTRLGWKKVLFGAKIIGVGLACAGVGTGVYAAGVAVVSAAPAVGAALGSASGSAIGGYVGSFIKMAAVTAVKSIRFW